MNPCHLIMDILMVEIHCDHFYLCLRECINSTKKENPTIIYHRNLIHSYTYFPANFVVARR
jgi:hypothetical protein